VQSPLILNNNNKKAPFTLYFFLWTINNTFLGFTAVKPWSRYFIEVRRIGLLTRWIRVKLPYGSLHNTIFVISLEKLHAKCVSYNYTAYYYELWIVFLTCFLLHMSFFRPIPTFLVFLYFTIFSLRYTKTMGPSKTIFPVIKKLWAILVG
jgi:hypothetical protein